MTDSAILATFADWRTVKGRKVLQLIFEVPLEEQAKVLSHLGAPMPMAHIWCGIARVAREGKAGDGAGREPCPSPEGTTLADSSAPAAQYKSPATNSVVSNDAGKAGGEAVPSIAAPPVRRKWKDMPASQRAALIVADPMFQEFFEYLLPGQPKIAMTMTAEEWLKKRCGVERKREIDEGNKRFIGIESQFHAWRQAKQLGAI